MQKTEILPYPEIESSPNKASKLLVFLHGVGSDGNDLISLVPFMKELTDTHFISPNGLEAFDMAPFGRQWFSLLNREISVLKKLIIPNVNLLEQIIKAKQIELNLTNSDTIIFGFSQGTMIGLYLTLTQKEPFFVMIGCSGRLIEPEKCLNNKTPICLIHGTEDDVVDISCMEEISRYLAQNNIMCQAHKLENLAHSIDSRAIEITINFIKNRSVL